MADRVGPGRVVGGHFAYIMSGKHWIKIALFATHEQYRHTFCSRDLDPMTLTYELDKVILKMNLGPVKSVCTYSSKHLLVT